MQAHWTMQEAQNSLPEVFRAACSGQPQYIKNEDDSEAVLLSIKSFDALNSKAQAQRTFADFLLAAPQGEWTDSPDTFKLRDVDL